EGWGHRRRHGRRRFVPHRGVAAGVRGRVADVQGFLDRRKRNFCRVFDLFRSVRHVQSEPSLLVRVPPRALRATQAHRSDHAAYADLRAIPTRTACPPISATSYWQSVANEMPAIKTFLIIVNRIVP